VPLLTRPSELVAAGRVFLNVVASREDDDHDQ
jgi:hypothetical protein